MREWRMATAGVLGVFVSLSPSLAEEDKGTIPGNLSANLGLFTDYVDRGISNTNEKRAIQGSIDYSLETGIAETNVYLGVWGSNVDFDDNDEATIEIDYYGGLTGQIGGFNLNAGVFYYTYPGAAGSLNYDYFEGLLSVGYEINKLVSAGVSYYGTPKNFGDSGAAHYFDGSVTYAVPIKAYDLTLEAGIGQQLIEEEDIFGLRDYWDWRVGATLALTPYVSVSAIYTDTDVSTETCGSDNCDARGVFSVTAIF